MSKEEFIRFMDNQIEEIEKFTQSKSIKPNSLESNNCVFEWIENNAAKFRKIWESKNS